MRRRASLALALACGILPAGGATGAWAQGQSLAALLAAPLRDAALPELVPASADGVRLAGRPVVPDRQVLTLLPRQGVALAPVSAATRLAALAMPARPLDPVTSAAPLSAVTTATPLDRVTTATPLSPVAPQVLTPRLPDPTDPADRALLEAILGPEGAAAAKPELTGKALALAVQTELQRVNCYSGKLDGSFGRGSNGALDKFLDAAKLTRATPDLTQAVLDQIIAASAPVCDAPYTAPVAATKPATTRASGGNAGGGNAGGGTARNTAPAAKPAPKPKAAPVDIGIYGG